MIWRIPASPLSHGNGAKLCSSPLLEARHMFGRILQAGKLGPIRSLGCLVARRLCLVFSRWRGVASTALSLYRRWYTSRSLFCQGMVRPFWRVLRGQYFWGTIWYMVLVVLYRHWSRGRCLKRALVFWLVGRRCWLFRWLLLRGLLAVQGLWMFKWVRSTFSFWKSNSLSRIWLNSSSFFFCVGGYLRCRWWDRGWFCS